MESDRTSTLRPTREEIAALLVRHDPQPPNGICAVCQLEGPQYSDNHSHPDCVYLWMQQLDPTARLCLALLDENEALRRDKERLDWLQANQQLDIDTWIDPEESPLRREWLIGKRIKFSLREAIDAAMPLPEPSKEQKP